LRTAEEGNLFQYQFIPHTMAITSLHKTFWFDFMENSNFN